MKIYLASGWFNDEQMHVCSSLENFLDGLNFDVFKPRLESKITSINPTIEERKITFKGNITNIDCADIVVAIANNINSIENNLFIVSMSF